MVKSGGGGAHSFTASHIPHCYILRRELWAPLYESTCMQELINTDRLEARSCIPPFATVWHQTTSREVSCSLVTRSRQMEWKMTHIKIKTVEDFPTPTTQKTVREFLCLTSYLRRYVEGFAQIAKSLNGLLATGSTKPKKNRNITDQWTPECQDAFERWKLVEAPILG